ncbi:hypothetical protein EGT07_24420 [Herbaspirillum sp. HC18]|nr:hypothetical protein EGT07_24420 [Herbaspirillum sp. HC18]
MNIQAKRILALSVLAAVLAACGDGDRMESAGNASTGAPSPAASGSIASVAVSEPAPAPVVAAEPAPEPSTAPPPAPAPALAAAPAQQTSSDYTESPITVAEQPQPCEADPSAAQGSACTR